MKTERLPTTEEINELPLHIREYIHSLETDCDPAGTIRENIFLRDQTSILQGLIKDAKENRKHQMKCAIISGLLANPKVTPDKDSMTIGRAINLASQFSSYL